MSVQSAAAKLSKSFRELRRCWGQVNDAWHDESNHKFDQAYVQPLERNLREANNAMGHMAEVLTKARADCE